MEGNKPEDSKQESEDNSHKDTSVEVEQEKVPESEPSQPETRPSDGNKFIIAILVIIILLLIIAFVLLWFRYQQDTKKDNNSSTTTTTSTSTSTTSSDNVLTLTSHETGDTINGKVNVSGTATGALNQLSIQILDDNGVVTGSEEVSLVSGSDSVVQDWSSVVSIDNSPTSETGIIKVFPTSQGEESSLLKTVTIAFTKQESADRIKIYGPIENQKLTGLSVIFSGEMKDFFEANVNVRLKDESGTVLFSDFIQADSDNYGQFAPFQKTVTFGTIPASAGSSGTWEVYEISPMDGSEEVLLRITVLF